jgi:hypothetical protein
MNTSEIIAIASDHLTTLSGHIFDVISITKPVSPAAASHLAKVISKLSPLVGNLIEFNTVEILNEQDEFRELGRWIRQDPGFPDTIFQGNVQPMPGFEIKAWFPLATEITARFKDSQKHFANRNTYVALIAWLPEYVIYGKPKILAVSVIEGGSIAQARDQHYHNPPDYLVLEPEDTTARTRNLQQTTTNGYKWQGTPAEFEEAQRLVQNWGEDSTTYRPTFDYQQRLKQLIAQYSYRLDTNFAKIDRIVHPEIEGFKEKVYAMSYQGMTVRQWMRTCSHPDDQAMHTAFSQYLSITDVDADKLVK